MKILNMHRGRWVDEAVCSAEVTETKEYDIVVVFQTDYDNDFPGVKAGALGVVFGEENDFAMWPRHVYGANAIGRD